MEEFVQLLSLPFVLLKQEITLFGFTFSLWQIIMLSCVASVAGYIIRKIFE